jgi:hypothetical protein
MPLPAFRAFGRAAADLEVDFAAPRPHLATALLAACAVPPLTPAECWGMAAGERLAGLLAIARATGAAVLETAPVCAGCGVRLDVGLPVADLLALQESAAGAREVAVGAATLRRATGADQAAWWAAGWPDEDQALRGMVATLLVAPADGGAVEVDLALVDEALAEADPLVAFRIELECPECGLAQAVPVDLQELALAVLRRAQHGLIQDVHRIARAYHWTEDRVAELPPWRRARYLALIEREEGA